MPNKDEWDNAAFPSEGHRITFMDKVRLLGVKSINVDFSGSGDSGEMSDPAFFDRTDQDITNKVKDVILLWPSEKSEWDSRALKWKKITVEAEDTSLEEITKTIANAALDSTGLDWYNNDGGQGSIIFTMTPEGMDVKCNVGVNYTETSQHEFEF